MEKNLKKKIYINIHIIYINILNIERENLTLLYT